jgi:hypothetical protein
VKRFWLILACVCVSVALFFVFRGDFEKAFLVAAIGAVSWFLNYRVQLKEQIAEADRHVGHEEDFDSDEEHEP